MKKPLRALESGACCPQAYAQRSDCAEPSLVRTVTHVPTTGEEETEQDRHTNDRRQMALRQEQTSVH